MLTLPNPLHPLVVHLPIALTILAPIAALGSLWAIRRGANALRTWGVTVALLGMLAGSAWLALETGEREEEVVEAVVRESNLETHEEAAEAFLLASGVVLLVAAGGLLRGAPGTWSRRVAAVATLGLVGAGWQVGHSGGALVYRDGAASAYLKADGTPAAAVARSKAEEEEDKEDKH